MQVILEEDCGYALHLPLQVIRSVVEVFEEQNKFAGVHIRILKECHHLLKVCFLLEDHPGRIHIEALLPLPVQIGGFV